MISVVLPAHNEARNLERTVKKLAGFLEKGYEIIVAEDGSTDGTDRVARRLERKGLIKFMHSDERLGRGKALSAAFKKARGNVIVYMDVDLATQLSSLKQLINEVRGGADIAIGSRYCKGSDAKRTFSRLLASKAYNLLVFVLFGLKLSDMQCGFKAFKKDSLMKMLCDVKDTHWFWDTELLIRASRKGYKIVEVPVRWREGESTTVNVLKDSLDMGSNLFKLKLRGVK